MALIRSLALGALCVLLPAALSAAAAGAWETWRLEWPATDFSKRSVDLGEIVSGGPPRDGIPAIDAPVFAPVSELRGIAGIEPVVSVQAGGEARAYPLRILIWHEIVNDRVGGEALTVTFCPLCNTAIVFRRQVGERLLDFGTTGKLRHSDLVMYDRQTESWWQQFTGEAIAGAMTGTVLEPWPARLESLARFRQRFPEGRVLVPAVPDARDYGANPYVGYDGRSAPYGFFRGKLPAELPALARVVRVGGEAWALSLLRREGTVRAGDLVLAWEPGQASALDGNRIAAGADVGNVTVRRMTQAGPVDVVHTVDFAFAFRAFFPQGPIHTETAP